MYNRGIRKHWWGAGYIERVVGKLTVVEHQQLFGGVTFYHAAFPGGSVYNNYRYPVQLLSDVGYEYLSDSDTVIAIVVQNAYVQGANDKASVVDTGNSRVRRVFMPNDLTVPWRLGGYKWKHVQKWLAKDGWIDVTKHHLVDELFIWPLHKDCKIYFMRAAFNK